jgi:hypothetical protein
VGSQSTTPPPASGGNTKYILIALLFIVAGAALYLALQPPEPPAPVATVDAGAPIERPTTLATQEFELPEEDASVPDASDAEAPTKRRGGGGGTPRESWECSGEIAAAAAQRVIAENSRQVRSCYERRLKLINTLQGTLSLEIRIGADGTVTGVRRAGGTLRDNETFACVRQLAENWRFPAPSGGRCAVISSPFNLSPRL